MIVFLLLNLKDITANKKTIEKQKKRLINDKLINLFICNE